MPRADTPRLGIHWASAGEGAPPVLFIGGTGGDLRQQPNVLDGPLPHARRTIAFDQRGLGQTDKPAGPYTMADYADDAAALLDHLGETRVDVVGVSFGGMVAQHLALRHPQRIRRLVLCCTSPGGSHASYPFHDLPDDLGPGERTRHLLAVSDTRLDAAWQAAHPDRVAAIITRAEASAIPEHATPAFRRGARLQLEARRHHDLTGDLGRISQPVLLCAGRHDGIAPAPNQQALLEGLPDAELRWYDGGHLFLVQDRQAWADIIAWLG